MARGRAPPGSATPAGRVWCVRALTRLQDVVCLLPHASQWNLPDTVVPAIEKSQNNIRAELELHGLHGCMIQE